MNEHYLLFLPIFFSLLTFPSLSTIPARIKKIFQPYSEVVSYIHSPKHTSLALSLSLSRSRNPYPLIVKTISNHVGSETVTTHCTLSKRPSLPLAIFQQTSDILYSLPLTVSSFNVIWPCFLTLWDSILPSTTDEASVGSPSLSSSKQALLFHPASYVT